MCTGEDGGVAGEVVKDNGGAGGVSERCWMCR